MNSQNENKFVYTEEVTGEIVNIPVELLHHHHDNPRKDLGDLSELTDSIKAKGILQNLTVVPYWSKYTGVGAEDPKQQAEIGYLVVIGNRRLEAAKAAGLKTLPCIIASMSPAEQIQTMLLENMQRSDLTVYEQAMGFQMMLDLGDSVEEMSKKTGFSKTTVRRRLKIAEMDSETLKTVSARQADLMDYVQLSEIEDIDVRNAVLATIGTKNFNNEMQKALDKQKYEKRKAGWTELLNSIGATEIQYSDAWTSQYEDLGYLDVDPDLEIIKELQNQYGKLFFAFGYKNVLYIRTKKVFNKEESEKQCEEQRRRDEERIRQNELSDLEARAFQLRFNFIKNYSYRDSKKNVEKTSDWMCIREIVSMMNRGMFEGYYNHCASKELYKKLYDIKDGEDFSVVAKFTEEHPEKALLMNVYALWSDCAGRNCRDYEYKYREDMQLKHIYQGLCALGYDMSDEERRMLDGTHKLYRKSNDGVIDTESDEIEAEDRESEDDFDVDLKKKLAELAGELKS